ncbi:hypothetical protein [Pseudomonas typographi]|uniref:hypothetical protein n=1 Tax=Pseudomonas typographi TaxID=2715964 RepID=UPI0016858CB0|nr:hypothetical protein [Pseudomonas typographi]MBD1590225.1 hypothetical protein [Pseudomonas typographi]
MKLIGARQAWADSQHEANASITGAALEAAASATKMKAPRMRRHEVVFAAIGDDKEARIKVARQRISIAETRRTPLGRSTARAAHLAMMGKIQRAIGTLPFQVQQFGHFMYHPMLTMQHVMNAVALITARADLSSLTEQKRQKAYCLITMALQSYKSEVRGGPQWGPARVAEDIHSFFGVSIDPKNWTRDWMDLWDALRDVIEQADIEAQHPVWKVIHAEKEESAA